MRVLHVLHTSAPYVAGYCTRSSEICRQQMASGMEVAVVTSAQHPNIAGETKVVIDDIPHWRTSIDSLTSVVGLREKALMSALRARVTEAITEFEPDVVHAHSPILVGWPAYWAARDAGIPVVYEIRDLWENALVDRGRFGTGSPLYQAARFGETRLVNRVDHVFVISQQLRNEVAARMRKAAITVIGNGVHAAEFDNREPQQNIRQRLGYGDEDYVFGYIGTFQPYEGMLDLVEAFELVRQEVEKARLLIVGGGGIEDELRRAVGERGLESLVTMTGKVPRSEVPDYYNVIDCFAYPRHDTRTTRLTTPLKPLEAMAAEKPVIVSDLPAMRELVTPEETGLVCEPNSAASLSKAMLRMANDRQLTASLVTAAKQWVAANREWSAVCAPYAEIYASVVAARN